MPITTYLYDEKQKHLNNKDLNEIIDELPFDIKKDIIIREYKIELYKWFKKKINYRYELLWRITDMEWQIINFPPESGEFSINTLTSSGMILSYLLGFITGRKYTQ